MKSKIAFLAAATLIGLSAASMAQTNGTGAGTSGTPQSQSTAPDYGRSGNNTLPPAGAPDTMKPGSDDTSAQPNQNGANSGASMHSAMHRHRNHHSAMPANSTPGQDSGSTTTPDANPH